MTDYELKLKVYSVIYSCTNTLQLDSVRRFANLAANKMSTNYFDRKDHMSLFGAVIIQRQKQIVEAYINGD
jgi:hypothetical protein